MKLLSYKKVISIFIICSIIISPLYILVVIKNLNYIYNRESPQKSSDERKNFESLKLSANVVSGINRDGKDFSTGTIPNQNCSVNLEQPTLNVNPSIYLPNYYMSYASLNIEN